MKDRVQTPHERITSHEAECMIRYEEIKAEQVKTLDVLKDLTAQVTALNTAKNYGNGFIKGCLFIGGSIVAVLGVVHVLLNVWEKIIK
jgi:hypothetical protein